MKELMKLEQNGLMQLFIFYVDKIKKLNGIKGADSYDISSSKGFRS